MMDGDNMGEKLAKVKNYEDHSNFSETLGDFASKIGIVPTLFLEITFSSKTLIGLAFI